MYGEVRTTERLTPSMIRIVLGGGTMADLEMPPASDAYINARFVPATSPVTVPFEQGDLDEVAADDRPKPRRFTVRRWDADRHEMTIDFVAHGDVGYAGTWAARATPGDRLQFSGPSGSYRPSPGVDWHLLIGDESALGAIGHSLEVLAPGAKALVFAIVDDADHEIEMPSDGDVDVRWLHRSQATDADTMLVDAVASSEFPGGSFDVFLHGEAAEVRAVRKHLIADRGVDPSGASISPYWRRDHTDEAWRAVKRQWIADQASDV